MRTNEKWEDTREGWMDVGEGGGTNRAKQLPRGGGGRLSDGGVIMKTTGLKRKGREKKKEKSN